MSYKHEIFLSYKWGGARKEWVDKIFEPILQEVAHEEIGNKLNIFKDTKNIVWGATLDKSIKEALSSSVCMISIVSLPYFKDSIWCPTEFSSMLYREGLLKIRETGNYTGLVFPLVFVDEKEDLVDRSPLYEHDELRDLLLNITPLELDFKYNHTNDGFKNSNDFNSLKDIIRTWFKKSIKPRLKQSPQWQSEWNSDEYITKPFEDFKHKYKIAEKPMLLPKI